jgi:hypothetical protein
MDGFMHSAKSYRAGKNRHYERSSAKFGLRTLFPLLTTALMLYELRTAPDGLTRLTQSGHEFNMIFACFRAIGFASKWIFMPITVYLR